MSHNCKTVLVWGRKCISVAWVTNVVVFASIRTQLVRVPPDH
jgi:hypothetical protein